MQSSENFLNKIQGGKSRLRELLTPLTYEYDYILIDSPPNWMYFSQSSVYAADVVLIPAKHNSYFSLENAAVAITRLIPEIKKERGDGGPVALPIFFNGEKDTSPQLVTAQDAMKQLISSYKATARFDLQPYFFPKNQSAAPNLEVFTLPSLAAIANSAFQRTPAALKNSVAAKAYHQLAKEYFL
jgi:cellulose biosynthesis protein BcsQ